MLSQPKAEINLNDYPFDLAAIDQGVKFFHNHTKEHAIIGISPFNGFFKLNQIIKIIDICRNIFTSLSIYVPTEISQYTLQANGYDEITSQKKTRRQDNYTINKVKKAIFTCGLEENILLTTRSLMDNEIYYSLAEKFITLFNSDSLFRSDCMLASKWILQGIQLPEEKSYIAAKYLLYELPMLFNAPSIVKKKSVAFVYHLFPEPLRDLYRKYKDLYIDHSQSFAVIPLAEDEQSTDT